MSTQSSNFGSLRDPGLKLIWGLGFKDWPKEYSEFFREENSKRAYEDSLSMSAFGLFPTKAEGKGITYDDAIQGPTRRQTHITYGKGFIVTREMMEDDLYNQINKLPKALARSGVITIEQTAANVLNRAFNASYTGADGVSLCNASHVRVDGGGYSNTIAIAADLDLTSLEQALIDIAAFVDDRGILIQARPKKLVVPTALAWQCARILKSTDDPETANRSINPARGIIPQGFVVNHYLTDPDAWFITTDLNDTEGLVCYWRRRPDFGVDNEFDSENRKYKSTFRVSFGWDDPRGIYGSPGA